MRRKDIKMNNFYTEHEGYLELKEKLFEMDFGLVAELTDVVGDAILYGIERAYDNWQAERKRCRKRMRYLTNKKETKGGDDNGYIKRAGDIPH